MYLFMRLLVHAMIVFNLVSCYDDDDVGAAVRKCPNNCDSNRHRLPEEQLPKLGDVLLLRLKNRINLIKTVKLALKKAIRSWRKLWNPLNKGHFNDDKFTLTEFPSFQQYEARTFGIRRRIQLFLWLPISFKLGIIVTLLLVLTAMSLKSLIIGFLILLLILANTSAYSKWWPASVAFAKPQQQQIDANKNIHIHVHAISPHHYEDYYPIAYSPVLSSSSASQQHLYPNWNASPSPIDSHST